MFNLHRNFLLPTSSGPSDQIFYLKMVLRIRGCKIGKWLYLPGRRLSSLLVRSSWVASAVWGISAILSYCECEMPLVRTPSSAMKQRIKLQSCTCSLATLSASVKCLTIRKSTRQILKRRERHRDWMCLRERYFDYYSYETFNILLSSRISRAFHRCA